LLKPHLNDMALEQGVVLREQGDRVEQVNFPPEGMISSSRSCNKARRSRKVAGFSDKII